MRCMVLMGVVVIGGCASSGEHVSGDGPELQGRECPVHHRMLRQGEAPVRYGLFRPWPSGYREEMEARFPMANTEYQGGCMPPVDWQTRREAVWYCEACREEKARYEAEKGRGE